MLRALRKSPFIFLKKIKKLLEDLLSNPYVEKVTPFFISTHLWTEKSVWRHLKGQKRLQS